MPARSRAEEDGARRGKTATSLAVATLLARPRPMASGGGTQLVRLRPILAPNALREDRCQDCPKDRPKGKARVDQGHTSASEGIEDAVEQSHQHPSIDDTNRRATRQTDPSDRQRLAPQEGADLSRLRAQRQQDRLGSGGIDATRGKWSGKLTHTSLRSCQQKAASFFDKSGMDKMMFLPCAHGVRGVISRPLRLKQPLDDKRCAFF